MIIKNGIGENRCRFQLGQKKNPDQELRVFVNNSQEGEFGEG
jgi:hypothetical protein